MRGLRFALGFLTLLVVVALVDGTYLGVKLSETAQENRDFICLFSGALTKEPIKQQDAETDAEFRKRVELTTNFVDELNKLDGCGFEPPLRVIVDEKDQNLLQRGGGHSSAAPPSSQPGPPTGGPPPTPPSGGNSPHPPPEQPLDPACELSQDLNVPLC